MRKQKQTGVLMTLILATMCATPVLAGNTTPPQAVTTSSPDPRIHPGLSKAEQSRRLSNRLRGGDTNGTFNSFASLLYALYDIGIRTEDGAINSVALESAFVDSYAPTLREVLDSIAWQTDSSWKYQEKTGYWVFAKAALPSPYVLTIANKWTESKRGIYVSYRPASFPVGLDVYCLGSYSAAKASEEKELWTRVRDASAIWFAINFKQDVSLKEMQKVTVGGDEALYFESPTPRPDITWRQWVLVHGGKVFVIVSTVPSKDEQLLSEVHAMVKSFRVVR